MRYWATASSGTRKERPNLTAGISPEWTRRYTVILETRKTSATSATVMKRAFEKLVSADISHIPLLSDSRTPPVERCADAEPSNNHVLDTLEADGANVKEPAGPDLPI
ncbi:hypothetical protein ARTHRO9V_90016 [Arthrobacter sp. 9V]|nr:hypothetical protein ARTHRO9V_90016 [Arthrobacter sp. 9V]